MSARRERFRLAAAVAAAALLPGGTGLACAEVLPVTVYTAADGLARDYVNDVLVDRDRFVWVATAEGLSRFDGQQFVNFGRTDGLPNRSVGLLRELAGGELWLVSGQSLCRFDDRAAVAFECSPPLGDSINDVLPRKNQEFWLAAPHGIYRLKADQLASATPPRLAAALAGGTKSLVEDRDGTVWAIGDFQLYRFDEDGRVHSYASLPRRDRPPVLNQLFLDGSGQPWVVATDALYRVRAGASTGTGLLRVDLPHAVDPNLGFTTGKLLRDGSFWLAGGCGVLGLGPDPARPGWRLLSHREGLPDGSVNAMAEDAAGNLWIGTTVGLARLAARGFVSYTAPDGLAESSVDELLDSGDGRLCARTSASADFQCLGADGRFHWVRARHDPGLAYFGWGWRQTTVHARDGSWWLASGSGVLHYPPSRTIEGLEHLSPQLLRGGLPGPDVFRLYEDRDGTLWVGVAGVTPHIARRVPGGERFVPVTDSEQARGCLPTVFREWAGTMWIGCYSGDVLRFDGREFRGCSGTAGAPRERIEDMAFDARGRLWIAARDGLYRVDEPRRDEIAFRRWTSRDGLASDDTWSLLEDGAGGLFVGHGRGIDRLDLASGAIRHFTRAAGLAGAQQTVAWRAPDGTLWFGGAQGLSALLPRRPDPPAPATPRLVSLRAGGLARPLPARGVGELAGLVFGPGERDLELRFISPGLLAGDAPRYEVRLDGHGSPLDVPAPAGVVTLPALAPGSYTLEARAVDGENQRSAAVAKVGFRIRPPLYRDWRVISAALAGLACAVVLVVRARVRKQLELERVRTRIATDLHDDLGASLSKVAITSEVLAAQLPPGAEAIGPRLQSIAASARAMVESLGDIVWTVDPALDRWSDLAGRMRHFGGELLIPLGIDFELDATCVPGERPVPVDLRRALYLAFKEAVHNAARHAGARRVEAELRLARGEVELRIRDDGAGFDAGAVERGRGLDSLEERARSLGGNCTFRRVAGGGAEIELRVPLAR
ncbi:MAG: hypothetical protein KBD01_16265 [Acidobacteria bacterium]|nr:hypothetical protein [Acidobacteriota bacterium]